MELNSGVTYSQTLRMARQLFGPQGRVVRRGNLFQVGVQDGNHFVIFGEGKSFEEAVTNTVREAMIAQRQKAQLEAMQAAQIEAATKAAAAGKEGANSGTPIDSNSDPSISSGQKSILETEPT